MLTLERHLDYFAGLAADESGDRQTTTRYYLRAAEPLSEFSIHSFYRALALRKLGREAESNDGLLFLREHAKEQKLHQPQIDTSRPRCQTFSSSEMTFQSVSSRKLYCWRHMPNWG